MGATCPARSALDYLTHTEQVLQKLNEHDDVDYRIASGGGRMTITMDRYQADWAMVERAIAVTPSARAGRSARPSRR